MEIPPNILQSARYVSVANEKQNALAKKFSWLMRQLQLPEDAWSDNEIELFLRHLASMDSNNDSLSGVGEREGRFASRMVKQRHFSMAHGIGRSGDILAEQPKAAGSSILHVLARHLILASIRAAGFTICKSCLVVPFATGMSVNFVLQHLASRSSKKTVLFLRVDQKSVPKAIELSGLNVVVIDTVYEDAAETRIAESLSEITGLCSNQEDIVRYLQTNASTVLAVVATTSCFAPREPDDILSIGQICSFFDVTLIVNNAYGIQTRNIMTALNKLSTKRPVRSRQLRDFIASNHADRTNEKLAGPDGYVISSADKNYCIPVSGAIIYSTSKDAITNLGAAYPGRASADAPLDILITLLSLGRNGWKQLLQSREELKLIAETSLSSKLGHIVRVFRIRNNNISIMLRFKDYETGKLDNERIRKLGAALFRHNISGARVITSTDNVTILMRYPHNNFGGHTNDSRFQPPYMTVAVALLMTQKEIDNFIRVFLAEYLRVCLDSTQSAEK